MRIRLLSALLLVIMLCLPLSACRKEGINPADPALPGSKPSPTHEGITGGSSSADAGFLTGIYVKTTLPLPEGTALLRNVPPVWQPETESLLCVVRRTEEVEDVHGNIFPSISYALAETAPDGVIREIPVPMAENAQFFGGLIEDGGLLWLAGSVSNLTLSRLTPDGEVEEVLGNTAQYFTDGSFAAHLARGVDGILWIASGTSYVGIGTDGNPTISGSYPGELSSLGVTPDGSCLLCGQMGGGLCLTPADPGSADRFELPVGAPAAVFGPGHDFYYADESGVSCADFTEDGCGTTALMNYINSSVDSSSLVLVSAADEETFVFCTGDWENCTPVVCRKSPDIDLSTATVLHAAYLSDRDGLPDAAPAVFAEFHAAHPGVRIVLDDFAQYNTTENPMGGAEKLARDLVTGICKPDILFGSENSLYMIAARDKGLCADLLPYLEARGWADDLFECVRRQFDNGAGGLWACAPSFSLTAYFAAADRLGPFAQQGCWTAGEFIDFVSSLPEGVEAIPLTRDWSAASFLLWYGYREFVDFDTARCSFDSPEFTRILEFLAALPTEEEYRRTSPLANLTRAEEVEAFRTGQKILSRASFAGFSKITYWNMLFDTKDWTVIGQPSGERSAGAGMELYMGSCFAVLASSPHPDLAWEALSGFFGAEEGLSVDPALTMSRYPAQKSLFRARAEDLYERYFTWYFEGGGSIGQKGAEPEKRSKPGITTDFTPEDCARLEAILDSAGEPPAPLDTEPLTAILYEELTAFLGGIGSPSDCAAKIQSRASLWLAEQS